MPMRAFNSLGLAGASLVLIVAFYYQLVIGELPCPLCLLQRSAFVALGIGFLLNVRFGSSPANYGLVLLGAVFGAATSTRHILLHIKPGDPGFGSPLFGIHIYTWSLIGFVGYIIYTAILLFMEAGRRPATTPLDGLSRAGLWLFMLLVAGNLVSTVLECGVGPCGDNQAVYDLLQ